MPDDVVPGRFRHLDRYGVPAGWLCPLPHMTLAEPTSHPERVQPSDPASTVPTPESPARRRPTPIPPREERPEAPPEWPLPPGDTPWWERH